jgi:tetrahydromethanopterin S-methyltransferase subunit A
MSKAPERGIEEAVFQLGNARSAKKCWSCGCLHSSLNSIEQTLSGGARSEALADVMESAHSQLEDIQYDCLGCEVCYPALAMNALSIDVYACPTDTAEERDGWPPLPGSYTAIRYDAPVAVCTLTNETLADEIAGNASEELAIVGMLQTENLGIERLILNVLANPNIRFLILCGADSRQTIGHLSGQSLVALAESGTDERMHIIGAEGKHPRLRNITAEVIDRFRRTVEVLDHVGEEALPTILAAVAKAGARNPGPAEPFAPTPAVPHLAGYVPERMVVDPAGYFVVYADEAREHLSLEHYQNDGVLDFVIDARTAVEVYSAAIDKGLLSRLDHAAYLGRELARAEYALETSGAYVQDRAPELLVIPASADCGCAPSCGDNT